MLKKQTLHIQSKGNKCLKCLKRQKSKINDTYICKCKNKTQNKNRRKGGRTPGGGREETEDNRGVRRKGKEWESEETGLEGKRENRNLIL